jgi:hypothetical protein
LYHFLGKALKKRYQDCRAEEEEERLAMAEDLAAM